MYIIIPKSLPHPVFIFSFFFSKNFKIPPEKLLKMSMRVGWSWGNV